jgi:hypothetical protein
MRPKKCPECGEKYQPTRQLQPCCDNMECKASYAIRHIEATRKRRRMQEMNVQKADRKVIKLKLDAIKPRGKLIAEADRAFCAYIRFRDQLAGYLCISSGKPLDWSGNNVDAGHYRSRGSAPHLRYDERNCHAQSKHDNRYISGNAVDYRIGLIARIGLAEVEALEADQKPRKYSNYDLIAIKAKYVAKLKALKAENK